MNLRLADYDKMSIFGDKCQWLEEIEGELNWNVGFNEIEKFAENRGENGICDLACQILTSIYRNFWFYLLYRKYGWWQGVQQQYISIVIFNKWTQGDDELDVQHNFFN